MRLVFLVLLVLTVLIQYPLWLGRGGWLDVMRVREEITTRQQVNEGLRARNEAMRAEVADLLAGTEASEERARADLGLMHEREVFVQINPATQSAVP